MKLLFCHTCRAVFSLSHHLRACPCGVSKGKYTDKDESAIIFGPCTALGVDTAMLQNVLRGSASGAVVHRVRSHDHGETTILEGKGNA